MANDSLFSGLVNLNKKAQVSGLDSPMVSRRGSEGDSFECGDAVALCHSPGC